MDRVDAGVGANHGSLRPSDNTTLDIGVVTAGGPADGTAQEEFCAGTECVITVLYDQSGHGNDLRYQGSEQVPGSDQSSPRTRCPSR